MNLTIGSLELNRSNPAHLGTLPPVDGAIKVNPDSRAEILGEVKSKKSFENFLIDAVNEMNSQQVHVSKLEEQVITDPDSVDIHDVSISMAKAQMSLNLAQTVIDRLVKGWTDLSQNR